MASRGAPLMIARGREGPEKLRVGLLVGGGVGYGPDKVRSTPYIEDLTGSLSRRVDLTVMTWDSEFPLASRSVGAATIWNPPNASFARGSSAAAGGGGVDRARGGAQGAARLLPPIPG